MLDNKAAGPVTAGQDRASAFATYTSDNLQPCLWKLLKLTFLTVARKSPAVLMSTCFDETSGHLGNQNSDPDRLVAVPKRHQIISQHSRVVLLVIA